MDHALTRSEAGNAHFRIVLEEDLGSWLLLGDTARMMHPRITGPRSLLVVCLLAALATGSPGSCASSPKPERDPNLPEPQIAFASIGSLRAVASGTEVFAWLPWNTGIVLADERYDAPRVESAIRGEITGVVTERGYVMGDPAQAQRLITFALGLDDVLTDDRMDALFGIAPGLPAHDQVPRGTLVIVIVDANTGEVMYRAAAQAFATFELPPEQRILRVRGAARRLLTDLPRQSP